MENPITFLDYRASLEKIDGLLEQIDEAHGDSYSEQYPLRFIAACLKAQRTTIARLNSDALNCNVAWDERTGLPSHPSLIADAVHYAETLPNSIEAILLRSLGGWTTLSKQTIECCCGAGWKSFKLKELPIELLLQTTLSVVTNDIRLKQLVGVRTEDRGHLENHHDFARASTAMDDCSIIFESEYCIGLLPSPRAHLIQEQSAETFELLKFKAIALAALEAQPPEEKIPSSMTA